MNFASLGKPRAGLMILAVFIVLLNLFCGFFIVPLFNLWRSSQPNLQRLAFNPYQNGSWDNKVCFSSRASDAYFSRVKESGVGLTFRVIAATDKSPVNKVEVEMLVNRGGEDFIEEACIVNGCIENFQSIPY